MTDSKEVNEPKDPDNCNLFAIYSQFAPAESLIRTRERYLAGGLGYGELKGKLFTLVDNFLAEGRARYDELMTDKNQIDTILNEGAEKARSIAKPLLEKARKAIGIQKP